MTPSKSAKKTTKAVGMSLVSGDRSSKRDNFNELIKEKEAQKQLERQLSDKKAAITEAEEIKELRKSLIFKAQPIQTEFEENTVVVPTKTLTIPTAPKFATKERAMLKEM